VLVLLAAKHRPTQELMKVLRQDFPQNFPQGPSFSKLNIKVDRLKAQELALTAKDVSDNVLLSLSASGASCAEFLARSEDGR
jgi:hypothetical protein